MEKFHYLHVWGVLGFDTDTKIKEFNSVPIVLENVGIEIDFWPSDELFSISPLFFVTERLRSILINKGFSELSFEKIDRITKGLNFLDNFPDAQLPPFYWILKVGGLAGKDNFALWQGTYLIVSERALKCLRDNHVTHAESDLISGSFDEYFSSGSKYFWMSEKAKNYMIELEKKKKGVSF